MAMYENVGYCPNNAIAQHTMATEVEKATMRKLGDLKGYMVYDVKDRYQFTDYVSVVDVLFGENSILGFELASYLEALSPNCRYAENGKMIVIHDVINTNMIADYIHSADGKWMWWQPGTKLDPRVTTLVDGDITMKLFANKNFLVCVKSSTKEWSAIHVYLMRLKEF